MSDSPEIAAARIEVARARSRFLDSVKAFESPLLDLKNQLTPSHLMADAWDAAKSKGADIAEDAVDAVRSRPLTATGVVAAIAVFLAREPLMDLAGRLAKGASSKRPKRKPRKIKPDQTETVQ